MELRPYQKEAMEAVLSQWETVNKTLLVLPTGCGKTIVFCALSEEAVRRGMRVLILAHRGELLMQASDKMAKTTGLICGVEKAELSAIDSWARIVVASVQTLSRDKRLNRYEADEFDVIIIDEAHHSLTDSYQVIMNYFKNAKVLGVTATPDRGDMRNLGEVYESLAYEYTLPEAIKAGYLVPIKAQTIPLTLDLSAVEMQSGDFKAGDVATALDPYLEQIAEEMASVCKNRKTVVFLPLVATSQKFCDILNSKGFKALEVNGNSKNRAEVLADFESGKANVLCNSMLLTEGWDCPAVDCVVVLRPTKVRGLYCQMVGRGTRPAPNKEDLLLLDFLWHTERHELCHPANLICQSEEVAKAMTKNIEKVAESLCPAVDIMDAQSQAESQVLIEREEALAKQLRQMRHRKKRLVNPLQYEMSIQAEDLVNYEPSFGWEMDSPTQKQLGRLEKLGILPDDIETAGKANQILERLDKRMAQGLTTPKQIRFLESRNFKNVGTWNFAEAKDLIDRIASSGWRIPKGVSPETYVPQKVGEC